MIALSGIPAQNDCGLFPLLLEQRIPLLLGLVRGSARLADEIDMRRRFKVIAIVGAVLVAHPFRLRFPALIVRRRIEKTAVAAAMQVCVALRTGVALQHLLRRNQLYRVPALKTGKSNVWHSSSLPRSHASEARVHARVFQ